jgi:hypothetical protein
VELASYFAPENATVTDCQRVPPVKFNHDDNPHSFATKALDETVDETAPGSTAGVGPVASQVGEFPSRSPLTADQMRSETHFNRIPPVSQ